MIYYILLKATTMLIFESKLLHLLFIFKFNDLSWSGSVLWTTIRSSYHILSFLTFFALWLISERAWAIITKSISNMLSTFIRLFHWLPKFFWVANYSATLISRAPNVSQSFTPLSTINFTPLSVLIFSNASRRENKCHL